MNLAALISSGLDRLGAFDAVLRARTRFGGAGLPVLCYHRVAEPSADSWVDDDLVDVTPAELDRQITMLKRHYTLIGVDELVAELDAGRRPRGVALITFDDGYRDNLTAGVPILKSHGVPATFFLASSFLSERRVYWWEKISYFFAHTRKQIATLEYPSRITIDLRKGSAHARRLALILAKTVRGMDLERFLAALSQALEVVWDEETERRLADALILTWDEVRDMRGAGMHFGSHTRKHRTLATLSAGELRRELEHSKHEIEEQLGTPIWTISYPVGISLKNLTPVIDSIRAAGYKLGFTNLSGVASPDDLDPFDVSRVALDRHITASSLRCLLAFPSLCTVVRPWSSN